MGFQFKLPDLGEGVREGEILRWLVAEGDEIIQDQPVIEVMTDKITAELPSPIAGRVEKLLVEAGEIVPVGATLLLIDGQSPNGQDGAQPGRSTAQTASPAAPRAPSAGSLVDAGVRAAPAVRRLARELGVDLARVRGAGPEGRISVEEVRAAASALKGEGPERIPLRGVRRAISERMVEAVRSGAAYTLVEEVDVDSLVDLRRRAVVVAEAAGARLTYLPFIIAALCITLREHPEFNANVEEGSDDLLVYPEQHIGMAVQTERGLIAPVIKNAGELGIFDLARSVERLSTRARDQALTRDESSGGTFTVTSLGRLGGIMATPILNHPQIGILGVHRIEPRAVVREGEIVIRQMVNLSLTLDHRYIDGWRAAEFMHTLKGYLEDPGLLLSQTPNAEEITCLEAS